MQCPVCKAENNQSSKFCQECGLRLELQCPYCLSAVGAGSKFCSECGSNLDFRCIQCSAANRPGAKYCQQCGVRMVTICFECQAPTPPGARFCQQCGARLERRCADCGTPVIYGARFCNGCGVALVGTDTAAPPVRQLPVVAPPTPRQAPAAAAPPTPIVAQAPATAPPAPAPVVEQAAAPVVEVAPPPTAAAPPPVVETPAPPAAPEAPALAPSVEPVAAPPVAESSPPPPAAPPAPVAVPEPAAPLKPEDERRLVTVLFGDVSGFTAMSEKLDPEELKMIMDRCLKMLADEVFKFEGNVDKFEGDLIMAVWGAPLSHEDDAERAVLAALDMQKDLQQFSADLERKRGFSLKMRIGINTGEVISGTVAAGREKDYTVMGDVVNTASRFEGAAEVGSIMVGEKTYLLTKHLIDYETLEPITVKGKVDPLHVYNALAVRADRGQRRGVVGLESPMVGRTDHLETAVASFHKAVDTRTPHMLTLLGIPGIGKSRLLGELQARLEAEGVEHTWSKGRSLPYGQGITFYPLAEILKNFLSIKESDAKEIVQQRLLSGVLEVLEQAYGHDAEHDAIAEEARQIAHRLGYAMGVSFSDSDLQDINPANLKDELFWAWRRFLNHWSQLCPLVFVLEDIHWADKVIIDLIQSIADSLEDAPILFICLSRPELLEQYPEWSDGANRITLHVRPLDHAESIQLLDNLLSPNLLSLAWKDRVAQAAGGVPFFIEEFIRTLVDDQRLLLTPAGWAPSDSERLPELPDSVFATVAARVDRLPSMEKRLLQRAAVVGTTFWESALAYPATQLGSDALSMEQLMEKGWLAPHDDSAFERDAEYGFTNDLARESAYKGLTRTRRSGEHRRVAEWLETKIGDRAEEFIELLAYHFGQGALQSFVEDNSDFELLLKAANYGWQAAERSRLHQAYVEALNRYDDTLKLVQQISQEHSDEVFVISGMPLPQLELELLLCRARVKEPLGRYDSAQEDLDRVIEEALERGYPALQGGSYTQKARMLRLQAQPAEATKCALEAIRLYESLGDGVGEALALLTLGEIHSDQAQVGDFLAASQRALELARISGVSWVQGRSLTLRGTAAIYGGNMAEGEEYLKQAADTYRSISDRRGLASTLLLLGRVMHAGGNSAEAITHIEASHALFYEIGDQPMRAAAMATLGQLYFERGQMAEARANSEQGVELARVLGQTGQRLRCLLLLAQAEIAQDSPHQALIRLLEAEDLCQQADQGAILPEVYRVLAQAYVGTGELQKAEEYARKGREVVEEEDHYSQGTTWFALALALAAQERRAEAEEAFGHALADLDASGETYEIGDAHLEYGAYLLRLGERASAQEQLIQAKESFESLNTQNKLERIATLEQQLAIVAAAPSGRKPRR